MSDPSKLQLIVHEKPRKILLVLDDCQGSDYARRVEGWGNLRNPAQFTYVRQSLMPMPYHLVRDVIPDDATISLP